MFFECYYCHYNDYYLLGRLVYFLGAAKGTDEKRRVYNPVSSDEEYILSLSKAELMNIGQ